MKKIFPFALCAFIFSILFLIAQLSNDYFAYSKVKNYYDTYDGGMSYQYFKITFRPKGKTTVENIENPVLHYGYNLKNNVILQANILQSEIPENDLKHIFYDTTRIKLLSPDSIYLGWISLRGNHFLFPFSNEYGFKLINYTAYVGDDKEVANYETLTNWKTRFILYAWASMLLPVFYLIAIVSIFAMPDLKKTEVLLPLLLFLLYLIPAAYVSYLDYEEMGWPVFISFFTGLYLLVYLWMIYRWATNKFIE